MRLSNFMLSAIAACSITGTLAAQTTAPAKTATGLTQAEEDHLFDLGKKYVRWLLSGNADSLSTGFDPDSLKSIGGVERITSKIAETRDHIGGELSLVVEKMTLRKGLPQFWHEGNFLKFTDEPVVIRLILDPKTGKIIGAGMNPKSQAPAPDDNRGAR